MIWAKYVFVIPHQFHAPAQSLMYSSMFMLHTICSTGGAADCRASRASERLLSPQLLLSLGGSVPLPWFSSCRMGAQQIIDGLDGEYENRLCGESLVFFYLSWHLRACYPNPMFLHSTIRVGSLIPFIATPSTARRPPHRLVWHSFD